MKVSADRVPMGDLIQFDCGCVGTRAPHRQGEPYPCDTWWDLTSLCKAGYNWHGHGKLTCCFTEREKTFQRGYLGNMYHVAYDVLAEALKDRFG